MGYLIGGIVLAIVFAIAATYAVYWFKTKTDGYGHIVTPASKLVKTVVMPITGVVAGIIGFFIVAVWGMFYKMDANTVTLKINSANHKITVDTEQGYHGKSLFDKTIKAPTNVIETNFGDGGLGKGFAGYLHAQTYRRFSVSKGIREGVLKKLKRNKSFINAIGEVKRSYEVYKEYEDDIGYEL